MVSDIISWSHPGKRLETHTMGVLKKSKKRCAFPVGSMSALFHDTGKLNPNFQRIIQGLPSLGYSHHAYLSVLFFYAFLKQNEKEIQKRLVVENLGDFQVKILQIIALISHHHGDLPNFSNLLNNDELNAAFVFLQENPVDASRFVTENLQFGGNSFVFQADKKFDLICKYSAKAHQPIWEKKALDYFTDTQFGFAALLEADKRDAGNNEIFLFAEKTTEVNEQISKSLSAKFEILDSFRNPSQLNKLRTEIRIEATEGVAQGIRQGKRVFTLTAPTGAGKTFTLLSVAKEIQKQDAKLGVIYSLPFLSITEQVQAILSEFGIDYLAVNSRAQNDQIEEIQRKYEQHPTKENLDELIRQRFSEETFDHPFIVTTFVQFFETLISNKNSTLLKLPNFSNRIFLIDEVQALPPRLYIFFSAWLHDFCKKHNSYAILSTATMPKLDFPQKSFLEPIRKPELLFQDYSNELPDELIQPRKYFESNIFNRYRINLIDYSEEFGISDLESHILSQAVSCLVILNTIADTKELYQFISEKTPAILLNTHFTVEDRLKKIEEAKIRIKDNRKIVLISTQLIEAGVDIDFPIVYRDLCPLPSLIQSAGRCNRNKIIDLGQVFFFQLINNQGKRSSEIIYKKEASRFLTFCKKNIQHSIEEKDLFDVQSRFFEEVKNDLTIGQFEYVEYGAIKEANLIECINKAEFETVGKLQLINEKIFGEQYQYYIPRETSDTSYDELVGLMMLSMQQIDYPNKRAYKIRIQNKLKEMGTRMLTVRLKKGETAPPYSNPDEYFGIRVLSDLDSYSYQTGLILGIENQLL